MDSNEYLTFGWIIILFSIIGTGPLLLMKGLKVKKFSFVTMLVGTLAGLLLVIIGLNEKNTTAQRNPPGLSQDAQVVQKLLHGEEVSFESYRTIPVFMYAARKELKLPPGMMEKIGDWRRYTIRFKTNDVLTVTNH